MVNGRPLMEPAPYVLEQPDQIRFILGRIDQDFFHPIREWIGEKYFDSFPYEDFIHVKNPRHLERMKAYFVEILQVTEHNPIIVFNLDVEYVSMTITNLIPAMFYSLTNLLWI